IMSWCASGIHPFLARINSPPRVCDVSGSDESVRKLAAGQLYENFQIADDLLAGREYFFDHFTAADAHFFWCFRRGTQFELDLSKYKSCQAHFERLQKRPSVQQCLAHEKTVQAQFARAAYPAFAIATGRPGLVAGALAAVTGGYGNGWKDVFLLHCMSLEVARTRSARGLSLRPHLNELRK